MTVQRIVHVVNRTLGELEVTDDGIPWPIKPGYKLDESGAVIGAGPGGSVLMVPLPYFAAERAKRQNPVLGTEDPLDPTAYETLIAVPEWEDDFTFLEQSAAIERLDRSLLPDEFQRPNVVAARGGRRPMTKKRKDGKKKTFQSVGGQAAVRLENPTGIRLE